ncbi:MAG: LacI family DNA-binding transcriptional regulator, partial [Spirochaetota bacterium]
MKKPTLRDVAKAAGVSVTTASLVLSGKGRISGPVRSAILDAATTLGYGKKFLLSQPGKRPAVGILLSIDPHWAFVWGFIRPIIAEIERIFSDKGYDVTLIPIYDTLSETTM